VDCTTHQPTKTLSMCVWASDDATRTFHVSGGDPQTGDDADFALAPDGSTIELGMSDISVAKVANLGSGIGGTTVMRSSDSGRTWTEIDDANSEAFNDRPFLVTTPHAVVMSFTAVPGNIEVVRSTDGGRSFSEPVRVTPVNNTDTLDANGGPAYDAARHEVLIPFGSSTDPTCTSGPGGCLNVLSLATSHDEGLTWATEQVGQLPSGSGLVSMPQVSVDSGGHRYLTYSAKVAGRYHIYVQDSGPGGGWSARRLVDPEQGSGMVQWSLAGSAGHLDVAYYRSAAADAATANRSWDFVVADSRDGGRTWRTTTVARHVYVGSGDNHQPVIWDLVGLARDSHGHLITAWTDQLGNAAGATVIRVARSK
jgi:hypothetical protein